MRKFTIKFIMVVGTILIFLSLFFSIIATIWLWNSTTPELLMDGYKLFGLAFVALFMAKILVPIKKKLEKN